MLCSSDDHASIPGTWYTLILADEVVETGEFYSAQKIPTSSATLGITGAVARINWKYSIKTIKQVTPRAFMVEEFVLCRKELKVRTKL